MPWPAMCIRVWCSVGAAHTRLRLPCFHFDPAVGVLPAFGPFTGLHVLQTGPQVQQFVVAGDVVQALPPGPGRARART